MLLWLGEVVVGGCRWLYRTFMVSSRLDICFGGASRRGVVAPDIVSVYCESVICL